jgi:hypothetical protein
VAPPVETASPINPNPEGVAEQLLSAGGQLAARDLLHVFDILPKESFREAGASFATGAFCRVTVGLRANARAFPWCTRLFAAYLRQVAPDHFFSSLVVLDSVKTDPHRDSRNAPGATCLVALCPFEGGQVWVEDPDGTLEQTTPDGLKLGLSLDVAHQPVYFMAKTKLHCTLPFTGRRVVISAYLLQAWQQVVASDLECLRELRFHLPSTVPGIPRPPAPS